MDELNILIQRLVFLSLFNATTDDIKSSRINMDYLSAAAQLNKMNASDIIKSSREINQDALIEGFQKNRRIEDPAYNILILLYSILIIFGATGNFLVVAAVARKPAMRTARNMFIVNLAVSDILLCLVTMPLTLIEVLSKYWPLGTHETICKMIGTLQATSIFVSTISITAIALDRYQVIVYPTRDNLQFMGATLILTGIWIFAIMLASPMFTYRKLTSHELNLSQYGISSVAYCIEEWPSEYGRMYYSIFSLVVQYLLPILIVSAAYLRIYIKLKNRIPVSMNPDARVHERRAERGRRLRRTNCLLVTISVIFGISWLPLNMFNLYSDIFLQSQPMTQQMLVIYAICHMMGMSSACSNPLLYGWLNENFRKEFKEILCCMKTSDDTPNRSSASRKRTPPNETTQVAATGNGTDTTKYKGLLETAITENGLSTELTVLVR